VRIWQVDTGAERHRLDGHTGVVKALAVHPAGSWLSSAGQNYTLRIWDIGNPEESFAIRVDSPLRVCVALPDGLTFVTAGDRPYLMKVVS